jgi:hypothetical protein
VARLQAQLAASSRRTSGTTKARPGRGPGPGPGPDQGGSPPAAPADLAALGVPDRAAFDEATESLRAGQPREAWSRAKPLFTAYPDVATVQDLRCQIAMKLGLTWDEVKAQCDPLMKLTTAPPTGPKG